MKFPTYKIHSLVALFKIRIARYEFLERPDETYRTWGSCVALNHGRTLRIGSLPLDEDEISPWRQLVLHEIIYFNRRYHVYKDRWKKAYEQCFLTLHRLQRNDPRHRYTLWQIMAFNEASRLNTNYFRKPTKSRFNGNPLSWDAAHELNAWILRQSPLPATLDKSAWDLALISITRDLLRKRRFGWESCIRREIDNFFKYDMSFETVCIEAEQNPHLSEIVENL